MSNAAPPHIQAAFSVIDTLDANEQALYKSSLTRHAKALFEKGTTVTAALLREHLDDGLVPARKKISQEKSYETIIADILANAPAYICRVPSIEGLSVNREDEQNPWVCFEEQRLYEYQGETNDQLVIRARQAIKDLMHIFKDLAKKGDLKTCEELIEAFGGITMPGWGDDNITYEALIEPAMQSGNLEMLKKAVHLTSKKDSERTIPHWRVSTEYGHALARGDIEITKYVCDELKLRDIIEKKFSESPYHMYLEAASEHGHWDCIRLAMPETLATLESGKNTKLAKELFEHACTHEKNELIDKIIGWGLRGKHFHNHDKELYFLVTMSARKSLPHLLNTEFFSKVDLEAIAAHIDLDKDRDTVKIFKSNTNPNTQLTFKRPNLKTKLKLFGYFLLENIRPPDLVSDFQNFERANLLRLPRILRGKRVNKIEQNIKDWQRLGISANEFRLAGSDPSRIGKTCFEFANDLYLKEGLSELAARSYAYQTAALLRSPERILQYLERWGKPEKQPLHDITHMIEIPQKGEFDSKSWGDALLQQGPKMAHLVSFADKISAPLKSEDGQVYSYAKTKAETAKYIFKRAYLQPEFAAACHELSYRESTFNEGMKIIKQYQKKYASNDNQKKLGRIPNIEIDGVDFDMPGYKFKKLEDGSYKGLLLGAFTDCCQHLKSAGAECAKHGYLSEHGGFYTIENENNEIIGQCWAWRGTDGALVLDSLEHLNGRVSTESWQKITDIMGAIIDEHHKEISALRIGLGGKTPSLSHKSAAKPSTPIDYKGYRDSSAQYNVFSR